MKVHLINPSHVSFGIGVITPRWLYVLASATPLSYGDAGADRRNARDRSTPRRSRAGDVVGIGIHTGNALRGYEIGTAARAAGAYVVFGGIHATLYPDEARDLGGAHAVVTGDGEGVWPMVLRDCAAGAPQPRYDGGRIEGDDVPAGPLGPAAGGDATCGRRCRPCAAARSTARSARCGGPTARGRASAHVDRVVDEIVELRRRGFRFIALADDNFYPVTLEDLRMAARREDKTQPRTAEGDPRRAVRADGGARAACRPTPCSSRRSRWKRPRTRSSSTRCAAPTSRARSSASSR